jgi:N-acetylglucosamine-6-phosphate deacetylase
MSESKTLPAGFTGPGLVDIQINGYAGFDFNGDPSTLTAERFEAVREKLRRRGVSAILVTLTTNSPESMIARAAAYSKVIEHSPELAAMYPGLHIEGPFISREDGPRGAHALKHVMSPSQRPDLIDRINDVCGGRVRVVTLAPETDGAIEMIGRLSRAGMCVAFGHTMATPAELQAGAAAGARMCTHLGNGSHNMLPRLDNYVQWQLAQDRLWASFIPDGHHMPFTTLKNFIRAKTPARSVLVTDAVSPAEMPPGEYTLGETVVVRAPNGRVSPPGKTHLGGSSLTLDMGVINTFRHCDVTFEQAWSMASEQPAKLVGLPVPAKVTVDIKEDGFAAVAR